MFQKALKIITTVLLFLVTVHVYGGNGHETTLTCKVYNNTGSAVFLYKLENGQAVSLGFRRPGEMDTCIFSFPMQKEGIYFIRKGGAHWHRPLPYSLARPRGSRRGIAVRCRAVSRRPGVAQGHARAGVPKRAGVRASGV